MTREQQIREAMKELGGKGRAEIERALDAVTKERAAYDRTQQRTADDTRKSLRKIAAAMHRAQQAFEKLPTTIQSGLGRPPDFEAYNTACITMIREKRGRRGDAAVKLIAAKEAQNLLKRFNLITGASRLNRWDKLAALLYGDKRTNMFHLCREIQEKERKSEVPR